MLSPKFSYGENVSQSIQSEGLTMMEGAPVRITDGSVTYELLTENISFVIRQLIDDGLFDGCKRNYFVF